MEDDIENLFNKHNRMDIKNEKSFKQFDNKTIKSNKNQLNLFKKNHLIKETNHLCLDENELYSNNPNKISEEKDLNMSDDENEAYFDDIQKNLIKENFYCSYSDHFDKIFSKNKNNLINENKNFNIDIWNSEKNKVINKKEYDEIIENSNNLKDKSKFYNLSCAGCFNQISQNSSIIKYFSNIFSSKNLENVYLDYMQIFSTKDLINYIDNLINKKDRNLDSIIKRNDFASKIFSSLPI